MVENREYTHNTTCPANYGCTNDSAATDVNPASGTICFSNTTAKSSDTSVRAGTPKKASQMQVLHTAIKTEIFRHRVNPRHAEITVAAGGQISFENSMKRIKENLQRLTGYELPVNAGDLMRASDIQTAYAKLNTSQETCVCVERCSCNAREADCASRCDCQGRQNFVPPEKVWDCACRGDCSCNSHLWSSCCNSTHRCGCNDRCSCDMKCNCDAHIDDTCKPNCSCNARTSVQCSCNIRNVCEAFSY